MAMVQSAEYIQQQCYTSANSPTVMSGEERVLPDLPWSCDEIAKLQDIYNLSWRDLHPGSAAGSLIFRNQGEHANRLLADMMASGDKSCVSILGDSAKEKCEALVETVRVHAEKDSWKEYARTFFYSAFGLIGVVLAFGWGVPWLQHLAGPRARIFILSPREIEERRLRASGFIS